MKKKFAFTFICSFALLAALCMAQSNESGDTHWGKSVQGVRLSVMMTNNVFLVGSSTVVETVIKNASVDPITIDKSLPLMVSIKSDKGKSYNVTTRKPVFLPSQPVTIVPGEKSVGSVSVTFEENIDPGDYTLNATQRFQSNNRDFTLESNSIKVTIVK